MRGDEPILVLINGRGDGGHSSRCMLGHLLPAPPPPCGRARSRRARAATREPTQRKCTPRAKHICKSGLQVPMAPKLEF